MCYLFEGFNVCVGVIYQLLIYVFIDWLIDEVEEIWQDCGVILICYMFDKIYLVLWWIIVGWVKVVCLLDCWIDEVLMLV